MSLQKKEQLAEFIPILSKAVNNSEFLEGGGFEKGTLTEICGFQGAGKTQLW